MSAAQRAGHTRDDLVNDCIDFLQRYYKEDISELDTTDAESIVVDHEDLYRFDADFANQLIDDGEFGIRHLEAAVKHVDTPTAVSIPDDVRVRVVNLPETDVYSPGEIRKDQGGQYVGIRGVLERVTSTSDLPNEVVFDCLRCPASTAVPQDITQQEIQEPHQCEACERQGFRINHEKTDWSDYAKIRVKSRPDVDPASEGKIPGYALDDLIDQGGDSGLLGRAGEPVVVYGIVRRVQKTGRGENEMLFDHLFDVRAIEFERDDDTVDIDAHRETFTELAARDDAVDLFAESIAPQLHATDAWDTAFEFAVAYLFGATRIDIPQGPTYRGDLHFLMITDFGMGKSTFKEDIEAFSPKCISKSTTALSSGVGLTAAAVKDDFGEGQWTIKPGLLVRANGGHLLLDEIDKGPDELTEMNDALEGEQMVDIEKAGQSATYESRTGVMALGNPIEGRFNPNGSISHQLGIDETLLSRFDGIVTMRDSADIEQDEKVAETYGKAYTEAQAKQYGDAEETDMLDRPVPVDVGQAWIQYARENANPILQYEQFEELEDWYANEVRQLNNSFASDSGDGSDMPVPATVRVLGAAVKMSIAFARVHLRDEVAPEDIKRAKKLGKRLVKQNWDGEQFNAAKNSKGGEYEQLKPKVKEELPIDGTKVFVSDVAKEVRADEERVKNCLDSLSSSGEVISEGRKYGLLR